MVLIRQCSKKEKRKNMKERIQKVLAQSGEYSRRQIEKYIDERAVKVNGIVVTTQGIKVDPQNDRIQVKGKAFRYHQAQRIVLLMNKPKQVIVSRDDPEERKTVYEYLPKTYHTLKPVGRLDYNSQGLILLTNDGDLILKLTHPRYHIAKVYWVKLSSHPEEGQLKVLRQGIILDGERTLPPDIKVIEKNRTSTVLQMTLHEGKNRQIRRMCEAVGLTVKELKRVSIGKIHLKQLRAGRYRLLTEKEVEYLTEIEGV